MFKKISILALVLLLSMMISATAFATVNFVYEAEGDQMQRNDLGVIEDGGFKLSAHGKTGHAIYGPYATDIPTGKLFVKFYFKLLKDGEDKNARVFNLDARDATADLMLAERGVLFGDMKVGETTVIVMPIENANAGNSLEFRAWFDGNADVIIDKVVVSDSKDEKAPAPNPKTGDAGTMAYVILMFGAAIALVVFYTKKPKHQNN